MKGKIIRILPTGFIAVDISGAAESELTRITRHSEWNHSL